MEITNKLNQYSKKNISLHVPGHHNHTIGNLKLPISIDMTEITGLDDYHHAEDIIKESESQLSRHTDYKSRYLINGTTVGILSVLYAYKQAGGRKIAIMRNVHKSVFNGIELNDLSAYILPTMQSDITGQYSDIDLNAINIDALKEIGLVVLTYPNYFGETFDIQSVIEYFHRHHIEVLVDEAHGAHFDITKNFPKSSLNFEADYVVQSYHKTLPALTMGSVLHINNSSKLINSTNKYLSMLQTSSPSYLVLSSLEQAHAFYLNYDDTIFFERRHKLMNVLSQYVNIEQVDDPLKLLISLPGHKGSALQALFESVDIYTELSTNDSVLLVLPLWHRDDIFPFEALLSRIHEIEFPKSNMNFQPSFFKLPLNDGHYQAPVGSYEWCELDEAVGHRLYEAIIPYPPGIPYILAGEILTQTHVNDLHQIDSGIHGMINGKIKILKRGNISS